MTFLDGVMTAERKVHVAGADLFCMNEAGAATGSAVRLGFRPRRCRSAARGVNAERIARIDHVEYLGPSAGRH
jgi:hypothetical protein